MLFGLDDLLGSTQGLPCCINEETSVTSGSAVWPPGALSVRWFICAHVQDFQRVNKCKNMLQSLLMSAHSRIPCNWVSN